MAKQLIVEISGDNSHPFDLKLLTNVQKAVNLILAQPGMLQGRDEKASAILAALGSLKGRTVTTYVCNTYGHKMVATEVKITV